VDNLVLIIFKACLIGIGATITFDLWGQFLKYAFKVPSSNICLVGRWIRYIMEGKFRHTNIGSAARKSGECIAGWAFHYITGMMFSTVFIMLVGSNWIQFPTLVQAIVFGVVTVLAPFFIMQPAFGFGFAGSKTPDPMQARVRSLMNHAAFGLGLYLFALIVNRIF
jgi:hypothetical protein